MVRHRLQLCALLFALVISLATVAKARKLDSPDFKVFYTAARHVLVSPADMYRISPDRYLYPPSTAPMLLPFAFTEHYQFHQWTWHALLGITLFLLARSSWAALLAMLLLTRYLAVSFGYGQINLIVIAFMAAAMKNLSDRPALSGAFAALASSLKVYPAVLFPAYLRRFSWPAILGGLVSGLFLFVLPFVFFGLDLGAQLYRDFFQALANKGMPIYSHNQSLSALGLRLFSDQAFLLHGVGEIKWSLLALDPVFVRYVALFLGLLLSALSWIHAWKKNTESAFLSAAAFSILFLSHIVWKDYLLLLYFPLSELFSRYGKKQTWILAGSFLAIVTLSSPDILGPPIAARLDAASIHLWGAVLVWKLWKK
jgi:hypothetical protein